MTTAVFVDSSGSVSGARRAQRRAIVDDLLTFDPSVSLQLFSFGTRVHDDVNYEDGGGTFLKEVFTFINKNAIERALIIVDDGAEEFRIPKELHAQIQIIDFEQALSDLGKYLGSAQIKVGDRVSIAKNPFSPETWDTERVVGYVTKIKPSSLLGNGTVVVRLDSGPHWNRALNGIHGPIIKLTEENVNTIDILTFMNAVDACAGATAHQRQVFKGIVLGRVNYASSIPGEVIVKVVNDWTGGCQDAKDAFLKGLGIAPELGYTLSSASSFRTIAIREHPSSFTKKVRFVIDVHDGGPEKWLDATKEEAEKFAKAILEIVSAK